MYFIILNVVNPRIDLLLCSNRYFHKQYTLSKISNWSPYIFMLVLKLKLGYTKFMRI